jgi:hypothetical protein
MSVDVPTLREHHAANIRDAGRFWTSAQEALAREMIETGHTFKEVGAAIGRTDRAVAGFARAHGLKSRSVDFWTPEELDYIRENFYKQPRKVTAARLGRGIKSVDRKRRELGMEAKRPKK